ncbi:hypothetical protein [Dyella subtropica]|uniref:hypothetical protein n=1 Tax=Dyella subtropica TaxID=2992127 RepID=UPI00225021B2|nr:hypothetical protein [Dyella subtropica]
MRIPRFISLAAMAAVTGALSGCLYTPETSGGYPAPCDLQESLDWNPSAADSLQLKLGAHTISLSTRQIFDPSQPGTLIEVHAYGMTALRNIDGPVILLDPAPAYIEVDGKRIPATSHLQENPFMKMHWTCGGAPSAPADLQKCGPLVLTFPTQLPRHSGLVLHLGSLDINSQTHAVPDIKYCYIPSRTYWTKFRG